MSRRRAEKLLAWVAIAPLVLASGGLMARTAKPGLMAMLLGIPIRFTLTAFNPRSNIHRALTVNPGSEIVHDTQRIYARNLEMLSGEAV